jgi:hypothetical protein
MAKPKDEKALVTQGTQALAMDYGDDAVVVGSGPAKGFEHQTSADGSMPFIIVLQQMTPVVAEQQIEGIRAGMLYNTVTQQYYGNPEGMLFVPATTRHQYTEFVPRDKGGGYRGQHEINSPVVKAAIANSKEFGEYYHPETGNELVETFYVFGVVCDGDHPAGQALMAFTSSKIKPYKNWISLVRAHTVTNPRNPEQKVIPPLYAHLTRITTEMKKNDKGTFHVPVLKAATGAIDTSLLAPNDPRFQAAKICKELVDAGAAKVNYEQAREEGSGGGGGDKPPF